MTPPAEMVSSFSLDIFLRNQSFNREAQRAALNAASHRAGRRITKAVVVVDMKGVCLGHTKQDVVNVMRTTNGLFSHLYPESVRRLFVINAPFVFTALWAVCKTFVHPITQKKLQVLGSNYHAAFADAGIQLRTGGLPDGPPSWTAEMEELQRMQDVPEDVMLGGFQAPHDVAAIASSR